MIQVGVERQRAYAAQDLWAMELLETTHRQDYQSGSLSDYPRRMPCLQSSDCWPKGADHHELDGMGYRHSFLKMDARSLDGLKLALLDPDIRLRLIEDASPSPRDAILGMWVTGGFLDGQQVRLNDNVNCLIGDTGSGKSVAIELLRFGLHQQPSVAKIKTEVDSMLRQQLRELGAVHILLRKGETEYLIERSWSTQLGLPLVQRVTPTGLEPMDELDMRVFFPIKCFSQSEIIEFAREPEVRLSLTDDLIDCTAENSAIQSIKPTLRSNAADIMAEQAKEDNIRAQLMERPGLMEESGNIDRLLTDPRISQHQRWYSEQTFFNQTKAQVNQLEQLVTTSTTSLDFSISWPEDMATSPSPDLLAQFKAAYEEWKNYVAKVRQQTTDKSRELAITLSDLKQQWDTRYEKAEATYQSLLGTLDKDGLGLQVLSKRRKTLQERISVLNTAEKQLQEEILPHIRDLKSARETLLTNLQDNRKSITSRRETKAKDLSTKLNNRIRLHVRSRANTTALQQGLRDLSQGSYLSTSDIEHLAANCHPVPLIKHLLAGEFDALSQQSGLESSKISKIWDIIEARSRLADMYELQLTDVEDIIEVQLQVAPGNYRRLEDLSHGQKCMVVLMVALAEGAFPLLVDQPEDALHAPSIEEGIVSTLRSDRGNRQCVFATRNANILVSADTEQIIALKASAQNGQVAGTGSLDRFDHRQLIIYHVEGGEEAFRRRTTIYTLEPSS